MKKRFELILEVNVEDGQDIDEIMEDLDEELSFFNDIDVLSIRESEHQL